MPFPPETTCAQAQLKPTTENCSVSPVAEATSLVEWSACHAMTLLPRPLWKTKKRGFRWVLLDLESERTGKYCLKTTELSMKAVHFEILNMICTKRRNYGTKVFISFDPLEPPFCFCCQNPVFDSRSLIATATTSGCFRHHCAHHTTLMQEKATPTRPQKEQTTVEFLDYHSVIIKKWDFKKTWTWSSPLKQNITRKSHICDPKQINSNSFQLWDHLEIFPHLPEGLPVE